MLADLLLITRIAVAWSIVGAGFAAVPFFLRGVVGMMPPGENPRNGSGFSL